MKKKSSIIIPMIAILSVAVIGLGFRQNFKSISTNFSLAKSIIKYELMIDIKLPSVISDILNLSSESYFVPYESSELNSNVLEIAKRVDVSNQTNYKIDVDDMLENPYEFSVEKNTEDAQILIYHTHGTESYEPTGEYTESSDRRTTNREYSVAKVASTLAEILNEQGYNTLYADPYHDYPTYNSAYGRSLATIDTYLEENPSIKLIIDVHRDAIVRSDGTHLPVLANINGEEVAQLMFVVGTDEGGLLHDTWPDKLNFLANFQKNLVEDIPGLMRSMNLRSSRFNQHATEMSILLEVGTSGNTLEQAMKSIEIFAYELCKEIE